MQPRGSGITSVLLCHKVRVLRGEMSVAHAYLRVIPVYNPQAKLLSIPAVT